jgi:hypothetical protein
MTSTQIEAVTTTSTIQRSKESGLSAMCKQCDAKDEEIKRLQETIENLRDSNLRDFMRITDLRVIADGAADDVERLQATIDRHYKVRP